MASTLSKTDHADSFTVSRYRHNTRTDFSAAAIAYFAKDSFPLSCGVSLIERIATKGTSFT